MLLLRKYEMYSALLHVFVHGLNDFVTPLEILVEGIFDSAEMDNNAFYEPRRLDGVPQSKFEQYGYKAILYIQHCFQGKTFPQNEDIKPQNRVITLRPQILNFLRQHKYTPSSHVNRSSAVRQRQNIGRDNKNIGSNVIEYGLKSFR